MYTIEILNEKVKIQNNVGVALAEQFAERFPDDKNYVLGKAEKFREMDVASCLLEWFSLDQEGRVVFCEKLGLPFDSVESTALGIKDIFNTELI